TCSHCLRSTGASAIATAVATRRQLASMVSSNGVPSSRLKRYFISQISRAIGSRALSSKGAMEQLYLRVHFLYIRFRHQPVACLLNIVLKACRERLARQTIGNGGQKFDDDRAGMAQEPAPRPIEAGIERDRNASKTEIQIERRRSRLVVGRCVGGPARAFGKNHDLA